jgi:hypothetical protein
VKKARLSFGNETGDVRLWRKAWIRHLPLKRKCATMRESWIDVKYEIVPASDLPFVYRISLGDDDLFVEIKYVEIEKGKETCKQEITVTMDYVDSLIECLQKIKQHSEEERKKDQQQGTR